ncbi:MAG: diguanylate cyclase [Halothiobacillaceae bacterium]|nr:diguanylate cyclase [Halothiobacillaceae bacterium]
MSPRKPTVEDRASEDTSPQDWKARYLSVLGELETAEIAVAGLEDIVRQALGRLSLAVDKAYPAVEPTLRALRDEIKKSAPGQLPLERIGNRLQAVLEDIRTIEAREGRKSDGPQTETERVLEEKADHTRRLIAVLVEKIAFTHEMEARKSALLEALAEEGRSPTVVLVDRTARLINDMRRAIEHEKDDLAGFLQQLTQTLSDLDRHADQQIGEIGARRESGTALHRAVEGQMRDMSDEVHRATDLDTLKSVIQLRLDRIRQHMTNYRSEEDARLAVAERAADSLRQRVRTLEKETDSLRLNLQESREKMFRDPLTGLANRLALDERLEHEAARLKRHPSPLTLAIWDIDFFKKINDSFGHKAGDKALHVVARKLAGMVRESDFVARYGGEEFVMLLLNTDGPTALGVTDKIREAIAHAPFRYADKPLTITLSCGLTPIQPGEPLLQAFERADQALYAAKNGGRNRCVLG